ncbi:hypothetical protein TrRE_jg13292 [Triparma retinervis]|uniref:Sulfurtransferase n=1 Tax=Triparma retinervis TaxID=2557542 RepID=A0A9W6ZX03_9STRA|nr:hypothetical protein TrRE_jg13292 [Triparma retinervis]
MKRTCLLLVAARPFTMSMSTSLNTFPSVAINLSPSFVDTSWFLKDKDKGRGDFAERRVNGAKYLDITAMGHPQGTVHSWPSPATYENFLGSNNLSKSTPIVLYQSEGGMAMYYSYYWLKYGVGHEGWVGCKQTPGAESGEGGGDAEDIPSCENVGALVPVQGGWGKYVNKAFVKSVVGGEEAATIIDVRGAGRFTGEEKEARPGVKSGHMPGAKNLPFPKVLREDWCGLKDEAELKGILGEVVGLEGDGRIVVTCGSGVTACIVATALEKVGVDPRRVGVYEGSWAEWGASDDTEVVEG